MSFGGNKHKDHGTTLAHQSIHLAMPGGKKAQRSNWLFLRDSVFFLLLFDFEKVITGKDQSRVNHFVPKGCARNFSSWRLTGQ